jgi:hypothetical protein
MRKGRFGLAAYSLKREYEDEFEDEYDWGTRVRWEGRFRRP